MCAITSISLLTMFMHEGQSLEDLIGDVSYGGLREELCPMFDHLIEILFHVLKDEVEFVVLSHYLT